MVKFKNHQQSAKKQGLFFYGRHPVCSAIANKQRQIFAIYVTNENFAEVKGLCAKANRNETIIKVIDRKEFDKFVPQDAVHQGFVAHVKELEQYDIADVCHLAEEKEKCHILILDQVTDPQNIGAIIRSCVAFDTVALVVQDKNSPTESGAMAKASAGMIEHLPIARVTNLSRAIETLKEAGFWVIGMDGYATTTIDKINKNGKTAIVMGSEGKGMRRLIEESCDSTVKLPISEKVESLNVATAAAITLYEINK